MANIKVKCTTKFTVTVEATEEELSDLYNDMIGHISMAHCSEITRMFIANLRGYK